MSDRPSKTRAIPDELIIRALLQHGSKGQAARALGINVKTLWRRWDEGFQRKYEAAAQKSLREATHEGGGWLAAKFNKVLKEMHRIAFDKKVPAGVRVTAMRCLLSTGLEFAEHLDFDARLTALERQTNERL